MVDITIIYFTVLGLIGGVVHIVIDSEKWKDLKSFGSFKRSIIGAACGFIYYFLYSSYSFPNTMMTFVAGYAGTDFIKGIVEKAKKKGEQP